MKFQKYFQNKWVGTCFEQFKVLNWFYVSQRVHWSCTIVQSLQTHSSYIQQFPQSKKFISVKYYFSSPQQFLCPFLLPMTYRRDHLFFPFALLLILRLEQKVFLLVLQKYICVRAQLFFAICRIGPSIISRAVAGQFLEVMVSLVRDYGRKIRISREVTDLWWEETVNLVQNYDRKIYHIFHGIYEHNIYRSQKCQHPF